MSGDFSFDLEPLGFKRFSEDVNFLKKFAWKVVLTFNHYYVEAFPLKLGELGVEPEVEQLLQKFLDFTPDKYDHEHSQKLALSQACNPLGGFIPQILILKILLTKLKISPYFKLDDEIFAFELLLKAIYSDKNAIDVFLEAGVALQDLPLISLKKKGLLSLNDKVLNEKIVKGNIDPNKRLEISTLRLSPFLRLKTQTSSAPILHWTVSLSDRLESLIALSNMPNININQLNRQGQTALMFLLSSPTIEQGRLLALLKAGIDQNLCDMYGRTALFYLLLTAEAKEIFETNLRICIQYGLNLNSPKNDITLFSQCLNLLIALDLEEPELQIWTKKHILENLRIMIAMGADVNKIPLNIHLLLPLDFQKEFSIHTKINHEALPFWNELSEKVYSRFGFQFSTAKKILDSLLSRVLKRTYMHTIIPLENSFLESLISCISSFQYKEDFEDSLVDAFNQIKENAKNVEIERQRMLLKN